MSHRSRIVALLVLSLTSMSVGCGARKLTTPLDEARQLLFNKKVAEAKAKVDEILLETPDDYDAMIFRGEIHEKSGQMDEAIVDFTKAIELGPTRPAGYFSRYHLYTKLAELESDYGARLLLEEAAAEDYRSMRMFDPAASTAFQNENWKEPKVLSAPIPGYDSDTDYLADGDDQGGSGDPMHSTADSTEMDPFAAANDPGVNPAGLAPSDTPEDDAGKVGRNRGVDEGRNDEDRITDLDLKGDDVDELTLPPHGDPSTPRPLDPPPRQVTRFDRHSIIPFDPYDPNQPNTGSLEPPQPRRATTGIMPPVDVTEPEQFQQRTRFFLQHQFGQSASTPGLPQRQFRTTGIHSGAAPLGGSPFLRGLPRTSGPPGFLPPNARGSFGPRLGTRAAPKSDDDSAENATPALPRRDPRSGAPILTTAIPGTTLIYGASGAGGNKINPNRFAPALSDPNYTPFVPRPKSTQTLPKLPK